MPASPPSPPDPPKRRRQASAQRRQAILDVALDVFAANGYAATRLDEIAEKAGVAKGTIYLSFKDKDDLFEQMVTGAVAPVLTALEVLAQQPGLPFAILLRRLVDVFRMEILATRRKEIIRLVISEGGRFPRIAEFYHREVIAKGMSLIRSLAEQAAARGELPSDAIAKFPQLVVAPLLLAVIWDGVFSKIEQLDVEGLLAAHCEQLLGPQHSQGQSR